MNHSLDMKTAGPWRRTTSPRELRRATARWSLAARRGSKARAVSIEPESASLRTQEAAFLPENGRLDTGSEDSEMCSSRASRGERGQRAPKDQSRNLGDPSSWVEPNAPGNRQAAAAEVGGARSSEEAGNDRGAKGPCRTYA